MHSKSCVSGRIKTVEYVNDIITHLPQGACYVKADDDKIIHLFFNQADRDEYIKENNLKLRK